MTDEPMSTAASAATPSPSEPGEASAGDGENKHDGRQPLTIATAIDNERRFKTLDAAEDTAAALEDLVGAMWDADYRQPGVDGVLRTAIRIEFDSRLHEMRGMLTQLRLLAELRMKQIERVAMFNHREEGEPPPLSDACHREHAGYSHRECQAALRYEEAEKLCGCPCHRDPENFRDPAFHLAPSVNPRATSAARAILYFVNEERLAEIVGDYRSLGDEAGAALALEIAANRGIIIPEDTGEEDEGDEEGHTDGQ